MSNHKVILKAHDLAGTKSSVRDPNEPKADLLFAISFDLVGITTNVISE